MTLVAADVLGFAGGMAAGVDQAGFDVLTKREPSEFKGFGVASMTYNMPWVEAQVAPWGQWDTPAEHAHLTFGCPPCSGFSQLSAMNARIYASTGTTYRGADAEINECMSHFMDMAARNRSEVIVMESVGPAFKLGREWMESLWARLRERSGLDYQLTHVNMNAALVGGDVVRPRYFFVAHLQPFGVGLEFVAPRTFREVVGDLPAEQDLADTDWGHQTQQTGGPPRLAQTVEWLEAMGREWRPGTRMPENTEGLEPPDFWRKERPTRSTRGWDPTVYSHWYSTDAFSPLRWRPDRPFGVVVAATLDRAVHAFYPRNLTFREVARFMSLPDDWSMRVIVEQRRPAELGKAIPTASARWVAHWARMSIEGTPGEYAGRDTAVPGVRVIQVQTRKEVDSLLARPLREDAWWPETSDPAPSAWLVDRRRRPDAWWQREDELGIFAGKPARTPTPQAARIQAPSRATQDAAGAAGKSVV